MTIQVPTLLPVDFWALGAVIALSAGAMLLLLLEFLPRRADSSRGAIVALATLLVSGFAVFRVRDARRLLFGGMFVHDGFTVFFTVLFCAIAAVSVLLSWDYVRRTRIQHAEYYASDGNFLGWRDAVRFGHDDSGSSNNVQRRPGQSWRTRRCESAHSHGK